MAIDSPRRHQVTVTLPRAPGDDRLVPPSAQVLAEAAAAAAGAIDLMTAWTSTRVVLTMTVETPCEADALSAGWAVARALGGAHGAAVEAAPAASRSPAASGGIQAGRARPRGTAQAR